MATKRKYSSTQLRLTQEEKRCLLVAVRFWLDTVVQEETDREEFCHMCVLRDLLELIV